MRSRVLTLTAFGGAVCFALPAFGAGVTVYRNDDGKYVKMGGRLQIQYHRVDPDEGDATDEVFFRRFRPYIEGSLHENWKGKFQWDMGKAEDENEVAIKDAYLQYKGIKGLKITLGNQNFPFSREFLTSSKYQELVERTFVGDHNYGTPDRNVSLTVHGLALEKRFEWAVAAGAADIDPDAKKLDFDTPVNRNEDFNQGWMFGGRAEFHPLGYLKKSQGDFAREPKATIGIAAFLWSNDDDNNTYTDDSGADASSGKKPDVSRVTGFEVSGAVRGGGISVDAEYNRFHAETVDDAVSAGLYENGETDLWSFAVEGGVMVLPGVLEAVAGYQIQDADGYDQAWTRTSLGLNWFLKKHDIKLQATYRLGQNLNGRDGVDEDELFVQAQYVF